MAKDKKDKATEAPHTLDALFAVIQSRKSADAKDSYTAKLFAKGRKKMAQKVAEEAAEVAIAAVSETPRDVAEESADLLYHLLVLWAEQGLQPAQVWDALEARVGTSGLDEKKARSS